MPIAPPGYRRLISITTLTGWLLRQTRKTLRLSVRYAKDAARFENMQVDPVTRRKLYLLKQGLTLPASTKPGAAEELAEITARLDDDYSTAKLVYNGKTLTLDDMEDILRTSRDPAEMRTLWEGWRSVSSPKMKSDYVREIELANEGSRELGYADTGALWRSWYDMPPDDFARKVDLLWSQVESLYRQLHCYVRDQLNARYGDAVQPAQGPDPRRHHRQYVGPELGQYLRHCGAEGCNATYDLTAATRWHTATIAVKMVQHRR